MESKPINENSTPTFKILNEESVDKKVDVFLAFMKGKKTVPIVEIRKYTNMSYATIRTIAKSLGYTEEKEYVTNKRLMTVIKE